jgi:flagellar basal-body rod protein FlgC
MPTGRLFAVADISSSGLAAERERMEVAAKNIANAESTSTPQGGPFRRQQVLFSTVYDGALGADRDPRKLQGVRVDGVVDDLSEFRPVFAPGHPDADESGIVLYPNVSLAHEMVDLVTAARAYEANLKSLQVFKSMTEQSLALLRGLG